MTLVLHAISARKNLEQRAKKKDVKKQIRDTTNGEWISWGDNE